MTVMTWLITLCVMPVLLLWGIFQIVQGRMQSTYYLRNLGIAHDQLWSAALGYNPDITISDIIGRKREEGSKCATLCCKFLNWLFDHKDHCKGAHEADEKLRM
jgi:hypothetical protein